MSEEKKDDLNEQQTFLNDHEGLLKSINDKKAPPDEPAETAEEVPAPETGSEEPPAVEDTTAPESPEPAGESPVEEVATPKTEPEPTPEPESIPEPEPTPETAPKVEAITEPPVEKPLPATQAPDGKKPQPQPKHSAQHGEILRKQALEQSEVKEVLVFFRKYAKPAGIAIVVICAVVLADKFFKAQRHNKEAAADTALMNAQNAQDLQDVVNDYASTPSAPMALMELAREKFNAGQLDEAEELYTRFTQKHAGHELAAQAELNLITCKESRGQFDEAHQLYDQYADKHEGSYLEPSARIGQARCLEALGRLDDAQIVYEDIIVSFPETGWSRIAEANLKTVLGKKQ